MNKTFYLLPYPLKSLVTSVAAYSKKHKKYGNYYDDYFKYLTENDARKQIIDAETEFVKYLELLKKKYSFDIPSDFDIKKMPIIDKSFVVNNFSKFVLEKPYITVSSSGTSGQTIHVPYSRNVYEKEYAFWWYHRSFGDVKIGDRIATFAGHKIVDVNRTKPPFWVYNLAENQMFFSSYNMTDSSLIHYVRKLNEFKPDFIHGYPSSIYLVAKYILENNIQLTFRPKMIAPASEATLDFQREVIEKAFNTKVYIWYGNSELCGHITECKYGKLHIQPYHSYVRIIKDDGTDALPGEEGAIVATNFHNFSFALINYNTKDYVKLSENQDCLCGKGGTVLDNIIGRSEDYIFTPEGRKIGRLCHLFKYAENIKNAQLIQKTEDELTIRIEKEKNYNPNVEKTIVSEARKRLGNTIKIDFDYDTPIQKMKNGKFKFIEQYIKSK